MVSVLILLDNFTKNQAILIIKFISLHTNILTLKAEFRRKLISFDPKSINRKNKLLMQLSF